MKKPIIKTLFASSFMALYFSTPHSGFMLPLVIFFLLISFINSIYVSIKKPEEAKLRAYKAIIWIAGVLIAFTANVYAHNNARAEANQIVLAVEKFKTETGEFPESTEEIGFSKAYLRKRRIGYIYESGKHKTPFMFYPVTYIVFDTYKYDFTNKKWVYFAS